MKNNKIGKVLTIIMTASMILSLGACSNGSYANSKYITLAKYEGVQIQNADIAVTDEELAGEIEYILNDYAENVKYTEGIVQDGDVANIDYVGTVDGEAFSGGADTDSDLEIGSGSFIDGFEDGLIGVQVGDTVSLELTFPTNYADSDGNLSDLAGKNAVFTVTVNYITRAVAPEFTDEFVISLSLSYTTTAEYESYIKDELYQYKLNNAVWEKIIAETVLINYPDSLQEKIDTVREYYEYYQTYYGYATFNEFTVAALDQTEEEFDAWNLAQNQEYVMQEMISQSIAELEDLSLTEEEIQAGYENYASYYGYETVDELLEAYEEDSIQANLLINKVQEYVTGKAVVINVEGE
ncbi:MAG: trigger factor [Clostridia bacterium]|jgi:trigger factor